MSAKSQHNPYMMEPVEIIDIIQETDIEYTFRLASDIEPNFGQFLEVSIPGYGEAPISVSDFGDGWLDLTIRRVGRLTDRIHELKVGDKLFVRGPYGNGFPVDKYKDKHLVIAAGGTGLAPVRSIINYLESNPEQVKKLDLLMGFKNPESMLFERDIKKWEQKFNLILTVDQADANWDHNEGLITEYVNDIELDNKENLEIVVVGPPVMMKFTTQEFIKHDIPEDKLWVSYERKMHCGIGKCGHCKIEDTYICLEGPVFNYTEAKNLQD